jgi:hypothetical protein
VSITSPLDGSPLAVQAGPVGLPFTASISDAEHGIETLQCSWRTTLVHDNHEHPGSSDTQCSTAGIFADHALDPGDIVFYEVELTVSDPLGLQTKDEAHLYFAHDCNFNGIEDDIDIAMGTSLDTNGNSIPDECETDCNANGVPDGCDIGSGTSPDCNGKGIPDECDIASGTSADGNGNGVPDECETIGTKFCASNPNSTGSPADISASGSASSVAGDLTLEASPVPNQAGIFFHGANQIQVPFGNGFNCVASNVKRGALIFATGNFANYTYDNSDAKHTLAAPVGAPRKFQYWHRDPMGGGAAFNTSNAISIDILP